MNTMKPTKPLKVEDVASVYVGKNGMCCCGCAGTHTYASDYVTESSEYRGYDVSEDEVDDKKVKRVVNKINKNLSDETAEALVVTNDSAFTQYVSVVLGTRLYIAYIKKGVDSQAVCPCCGR